MEGNTISVSCTIAECEDLICRAIVGGSITGERIDRYEVPGPEDRRCVVLVFVWVFHILYFSFRVKTISVPRRQPE